MCICIVEGKTELLLLMKIGDESPIEICKYEQFIAGDGVRYSSPLILIMEIIMFLKYMLLYLSNLHFKRDH